LDRCNCWRDFYHRDEQLKVKADQLTKQQPIAFG
jgi:hypothetical protein